MLDYDVHLRDFFTVWISDRLDDLPEKTEYINQPDHPNVEHDSVETITQIEKRNQTVHCLDYQGS